MPRVFKALCGAGTELMHGRRSFHPVRSVASRVYGVATEAMLNFGYWGIVPMFAVWGVLVGWYRKKLSSWQVGGRRFFLTPFFAQIMLSLSSSSSSSNGFVLLGNGELLMIRVIPITERRAIGEPI